jgi:hypothetical protein
VFLFMNQGYDAGVVGFGRGDEACDVDSGLMSACDTKACDVLYSVARLDRVDPTAATACRICPAWGAALPLTGWPLDVLH